MATKKQLRVAIVHDWLYGGGAERVVFELHKMFPDAPIYTSYCSDEWRKKLDGKVVTGYLQHWPLSKLRKFLPVLRIWWFESLKLDGFDLVISSSGNGEAMGVKISKRNMENGKWSAPVHVCYCHSPTHFYWRHYAQYMKRPGFGIFDPLARLGLRLLVGPLRKWDLMASKRPDYFIANSTNIQADIKKYYGRDSVVVHPPVNVERFETKNNGQRAKNGFVTVGRLVPYKRVDLIVEACTKLNVPLTVAGRGPELANLKKIAGPTVKFDSNASDEKVADYMRNAAAFLFAADEDFGITPVEALAAGTPVIAFKSGGALDYIVPGKTGEFFEKQSAESLAEALHKFKSMKYDPQEIQAFARQFSAENFIRKMEACLRQTTRRKL